MYRRAVVLSGMSSYISLHVYENILSSYYIFSLLFLFFLNKFRSRL
jgi:hypothetical protein